MSNKLNKKQWEPLDPKLVSCPCCRDRLNYDQKEIIKQFDVANEERYQPANGNTFCNIFTWDCTRALGCEIPHWWNGKELNANATVDWLNNHGKNYGWQKIQLKDATDYVNIMNAPVVVVWKNPISTKPGHVAMLLSVVNGVPMIAQSGARCFYNEPLQNGFGKLQVEYWGHA